MAVTPDLLLFLAGKMGLANPHIRDGEVWFAKGRPTHFRDYRPHKDLVQFGRLVVWAAMQGLAPLMTSVYAMAGHPGCSDDVTERHDSTEAGIMAAAVVAIARALGWEGE